jgi:hypothetical protein
MEEYDFAIIYFGMTRSVRKTYESHINHVFNVLKNNLPYKISQECFVVMQPGGISNKNIKSFYISTIEILKSLKINNIYSNFFFVLLRFPIKIIQFII